MIYVATNAATAAVRIMTVSFLFRSFLFAGNRVMALGLEGATLGLFLARFIFRCRLSGTKGNLLSMMMSGSFLYSILTQRRKGSKPQINANERRSAFIR